VEQLDFDNHKAYVRKVEPDYFTTAMTYTRVEVIEQERTQKLSFAGEVDDSDIDVASAGLGEVSVVEKVVGYKKIKFHTHENVGYGDVRLPEMQMHTTAFWVLVPERVVESLPYARPTVIDALRGFGNALHTVAAMGLMIDPRDLGHTLGDRTDPDSPPGKRRGAPGFDPTLFLYDHVPGGIGLAPRLFEARDELLRRARSLALDCSCSAGCPACIGPEVGQVVTPTGEVTMHAAGQISRKRVIAELLQALGVVATH
jgi:DEAD/DEAH box helicase domain-containing protein